MGKKKKNPETDFFVPIYCSVTCNYILASKQGVRVKLEESPRPITNQGAGVYFAEYEGLLVANAHCPVCQTRYVAWVDESQRFRYPRDRRNDELGYVDLSYRSSFNDEPGDGDLPFRVVTCEGKPVVIRLPKNVWDEGKKQVILIQSTRVVLLLPWPEPVL